MELMDLNVKYRKVHVWLESLFAGKPVPRFEHNELTIDLLYQLMEKNMARDQDMQLVIKDLQQKATEYTVEGQRLTGILASLNLATGTLSQSGVMSLRSLANLAWLLKIKDASDTSYLLALQSLQDERNRLHEEFLAEEHLLNQLTLKTKNALVKYNALFKAHNNLDDKSQKQETKVQKQAEEINFLRCKIQEYTKMFSKLQNTLSSTGVDSSLFHENLIKKAQDLQKLEEKLEPLKKKLQDYHDLPPDITQAKVKLAELRQQVSHLEEELSQKIDLMKL